MGLGLVLLIPWGCASNNNNSNPTSPAPPTHTYAYSFGFTFGNHGTGNGQFNNAQGIAVYHGAIFVADDANNRVEKFDAGGFYQGSAPVTSPVGLALDSHGIMYVASATTGKIVVMDQNFNPVTIFGTPGAGISQFNFPQEIALDAQGQVYVADYSNNRIQRCSNYGSSCVTLGGTAIGTGNGQFNGPYGVFVDNGGNVWVSDTGNSRVQEFDSSLNFIQKWGTFGAGNGQFNGVNAIRMDQNGNLIVVDTGNHRVQLLTTSGSYLGLIGSGYTGANYLAIDPVSQTLYITDYSANDVWVFTSN